MKMLQVALSMLVASVVVGCGGGDDDDSQGGGGIDDVRAFTDPIPTDMNAVLSERFPDIYLSEEAGSNSGYSTDGSGDGLDLGAGYAGPEYKPWCNNCADQITDYQIDSADVTEIQFGVDVDFLYIRVDFAGPVPTSPIHIPAEAGNNFEEQWITNQGMNVAMDSVPGVGGGGEGVDGIDIFFAVNFIYGVQTAVYTNYSFPDGDVHNNEYQDYGELIEGGMGHDYVLVRFYITDKAPYYPSTSGQTVNVGSWSEAESYTAASGGTLFYHHFFYDLIIDSGTFTIP